MLDQPAGLARDGAQTRRRPRLDLQDHVADLEACGLLLRIERPINKDTELHPLVRWQFLGGVPEEKRRAFLFTDVRDAKGTTSRSWLGRSRLPPTLCDWHGQAGRGDRTGLAAGDRASACSRGRATAALPGGRAHGR